MFIKTNIAIAAAIVLATAATTTVSAATKHGKMSPRPLYDRATVFPGPLGNNSDSPAATGGGSIGYNQNIYNW